MGRVTGFCWICYGYDGDVFGGFSQHGDFMLLYSWNILFKRIFSGMIYLDVQSRWFLAFSEGEIHFWSCLGRFLEANPSKFRMPLQKNMKIIWMIKYQSLEVAYYYRNNIEPKETKVLGIPHEPSWTLLTLKVDDDWWQGLCQFWTIFKWRMCQQSMEDLPGNTWFLLVCNQNCGFTKGNKHFLVNWCYWLNLLLRIGIYER